MKYRSLLFLSFFHLLTRELDLSLAFHAASRHERLIIAIEGNDNTIRVTAIVGLQLSVQIERLIANGPDTRTSSESGKLESPHKAQATLMIVFPHVTSNHI